VRVIFSEDVTQRPALSPEHEVLEVLPRLWTLRVNGTLGSLIGTLARLPVEDLMVEEPHLEDVVMRYYREDK
jgi:hypothetical protein